MFDLPLHPIVVHFPIVLGSLLPFLAILLWWAVKKGHAPSKAWALVPAVALLYCATAIVAVELGEDDEEKVEKVVAEHLIEHHEEAAELIPWLAGGLLLIGAAGLLPRYADKSRGAFIVLALAALVPLGNAGHTGGELVYEYGAPVAHISPQYKAMIQAGQVVTDGKEGEHKHDEDEDDHDDHDEKHEKDDD